MEPPRTFPGSNADAADILVSYSSQDKAAVAALVDRLEQRGYRVWWDNDLRAGEEISAKIDAQISEVIVVIVYWTHASKESIWVKAEANRALHRKKLLPLRTRELFADDLPLPHSQIRSELAEDFDGLIRELDLRGVKPRPVLLPDMVDGRLSIQAPIVHNADARRFRPGDGRLQWFRDLQAGPEMVVVPASSDLGVVLPGRLQHYVVKRPFAVSRFATTFEEWDAAVESGGVSHRPHDEDWGRARRPVINVSWAQAQAYVHWLHARTGYAYRLLTELEWEYCCRAGKTTKYSTGETISREYAQYSESITTPAGQTIEVGSLNAPNEFGLHDMHGNVWEWCHDPWPSRSDNVTGQPKFRIARGGGWNSLAEDITCESCTRYTAANGKNYLGFRVARDI